MKNIITSLWIILTILSSANLFSQVIITQSNESPDPSAILDVRSTSMGFLPPVMTSAQRNAISSPAPGLTIVNSDVWCIQFFNGSGWVNLCDGTTDTGPFETLIGGNATEQAHDVAEADDGGYVIAGYSGSNNDGDVDDISNGGDDFWVVKIDDSGEIVWNFLYGGSANDWAYAIDNTSDGGYVVAGVSWSDQSGDVTGTNNGNSDYWIIKIDGSGSLVWQTLIGGSSSESAYDVIQTTDGGYLANGFSQSSDGDVSGTNHGSSDYWVVKLDAMGSISWNILYGGNQVDWGTVVDQTTDGGYILGGHSESSNNGDVTDLNHGFEDMWIVKINASGVIQWNFLYGGNAFELIFGIDQTTDGGYILGGYSNSNQNGDVLSTSNGNMDFWVVKLDALGTISWQNLYGGSGWDYGQEIWQTPDGGYIITGDCTSSNTGDIDDPGNGQQDYWTIKLDATGVISWQELYGGAGEDWPKAIRPTSSGDYVIVGYSSSSATGNVNGTNHGNYDYWIVRLSSTGGITW